MLSIDRNLTRVPTPVLSSQLTLGLPQKARLCTAVVSPQLRLRGCRDTRVCRSVGRRVGQINIPIGDYGGDACGQGGNVGGGGQPFVCLDSGFGKSEKAGWQKPPT